MARIDNHHICYLTFDFGGVHYTMDLLVREVSTEDLFNLPLYEHHLVIDTRARREFDAGHVASAVSYPSPCFDDPDCTESDREKSLLAFAQAYARFIIFISVCGAHGMVVFCTEGCISQLSISKHHVYRHGIITLSMA